MIEKPPATSKKRTPAAHDAAALIQAASDRWLEKVNLPADEHRIARAVSTALAEVAAALRGR